MIPSVDLDGRTRSRLLRIMHWENRDRAEAARLAEIRAQVRLDRRRNARVQAAAQRIQSLLDWLHVRMIEEKLEALRRGERRRADTIERDIDELFDRFNAAVQED